MIKLGTHQIKNYVVYITDTKPYNNIRDIVFYEVLLTKKQYNCNFYIDLHKDPLFDFINFKALPKEIKIKKKKLHNEEVECEVEEKLEDSLYREEYRSWNDRREMSQPMYKLSIVTLYKLLDKLNQL